MKHQATKIGDIYNVVYDDAFRNTVIRALQTQIAQGGNVGSALRALSTLLPAGKYMVSPSNGEPIRYNPASERGKVTEKNLLSVGWYKLNVK